MPTKVAQWEDIASKYQQGTILLGNGASIAVSSTFGYQSLLECAKQTKLLEKEVDQLFDFFKTSDFELVLRIVWQAMNVNRSLKIKDDRTYKAYMSVRSSLIQAVRNVHPEYEKVSSLLPNMYRFLKQFDTVLTLNYDLLVYWTITHGLGVEDGHMFKDCFGKGGTFADDWQRYRDLYKEKTNTLVFYPHGCLALCRNSVEQESKISSAQDGLLDSILQEWQCEKVVPLFVSEGAGEQKVASIRNSYYLSTVYREVLTSPRSTLTLYGWAMGEHDRHLLKRMRGCGIRQVAVSVFDNSQTYCNYAQQVLKEDLGEIEVDFFDSGSPGCWIHPIPALASVPS